MNSIKRESDITCPAPFFSVALMEQQMLIPFRVNRAHHNLQFFVAHDRVAALRVQFGDQVAQRRDQRVGLRNDLVALQCATPAVPEVASTATSAGRFRIFAVSKML